MKDLKPRRGSVSIFRKSVIEQQEILKVAEFAGGHTICWFHTWEFPKIVRRILNFFGAKNYMLEAI